MKNRSVVIIGDGMVGSTIAYTLLQEDYVTDISIIDTNTSKVEGDVLDLVHGMSFVGPKRVKVGKYSDIKDAHVVVITAGVAQKEGETRIDLLKRNLKVFDSIIDSMKPYVHDDLVVLVVTNPVDILTYYTYKKLGIPANRVIGSGTVLDTSRLKTVIAEETHVDPRNVHTYILGEHGDSEIPAWSVTNIAGLPLDKYCTECGWKKGEKGLNDLFSKVKNAAYEIISKKGATYYAVGLSVNKILKTILNNTNSVLTVSTHIEDDKFGYSDFYFSLPCIVNSSGVKEVLQLDYSKEEIEGLSKSAGTLKELINQIEE